MIDELEWATKGSPLPKSRAEPPKWAALAIVRSTGTLLAPLYDLDPAIKENVTLANELRLRGMAGALLAFMTEPVTDDSAPSGIDAEATALKEKLAERVAAKVAPKLRALTTPKKRKNATLPTATVAQLQENIACLHEGATALIDGRGEFKNGATAKAQIYSLIWFCWPELLGLEKVAEVHAALETFGVSFGRKQVEAICTELQMFRGRRGRPRRANKILETTKRE